MPDGHHLTQRALTTGNSSASRIAVNTTPSLTPLTIIVTSPLLGSQTNRTEFDSCSFDAVRDAYTDRGTRVRWQLLRAHMRKNTHTSGSHTNTHTHTHTHTNKHKHTHTHTRTLLGP
jgi:hypothetical protein